jgi:simple sugar transport system substrate-binding protein
LVPLALGALILAGCSSSSEGSDATATDTTATETTTETTTTEETTEVVAASGDKWCAGTKIVYFQGGDADPFASILGAGARQAAEDTGANLEIIQSGWDFTKMVEQFRQVIASKPDGISFMGHPGDPAILPLAEEAKAAGIFVDYSNVPPAETLETVGGGFVGANLRQMGVELANRAVADFGLQAGDQAIVIGAFGSVGREDREVGVADTLEEKGIVVERIRETDDSSADPNLLTPAVVAALSAKPNTKLLVLGGGPILGGTPIYFEAAGIEPGQINVIGFDLGQSVIEAFKSGHVQLTGDQEPFKQGYFPVVSLCMQDKFGLSPLKVDTSAGFVTVDNYATVEPLTQAGIR